MKGVVLISFFAFALYSCQNKTSFITGSEIYKIDNYHCWPYDVTVYSFDKISIDSLYKYPLKSYFEDNNKYEYSNWDQYSNINKEIWDGMNKELSQCDNNSELYNCIKSNEKLLYSGSFQYFKNSDGEKKKKYEKILFMDLKGKKIHVFKDINKVF